MTKTLIANLGHAGVPVLTPAGLTRLEIDGVSPGDVQAMSVVVDASVSGQPATFCLHRLRILDGMPFEAEEAHAISNMSLIIEYEEGA